MAFTDMTELNRRFCTDYKVPLKIFNGDVFIERIKLFGFYDTYKEYIAEIENRFSDEQSYFEYYNSVKEKAMAYIKESKSYTELQKTEFKFKSSYAQSDVYKETNVGKSFISIDMRKANFTALKHFGHSIGAEFCDGSYEDWLTEFTDVKAIIKSKYIRQVIFGNCNPKHQIAYEKYLMNVLLEKLIEAEQIKETDVVSFMSDEIILSAENISYEQYLGLKAYIEDIVDFDVRVEYYKLFRINGTDGYIREIQDGVNKISDIKCLNSEDAPFVYRFLDGDSYDESDYLFWHNHKLARFLEAPNISISGDEVK